MSCPRHRRYWARQEWVLADRVDRVYIVYCPCDRVIGRHTVTVTVGPRGGRAETSTWAWVRP